PEPGDRSPHRPDPAPPAGSARGGHRRDDRGAGGGRGDRAAREGGQLMGADLATLVGIRPTVREAIERAAIALRIAGIEDGRVDAEWLLAETLGLARGRLHLQARQALGADDVARYVSVLSRRLAREPLQHIMGREAFRGLTLRVTGDALVPRP